MRPVWLATALALASTIATAQQTFTLQQVLSAPYALQLTAAPVGNHFAWIENAEGRRNIWIGSPTEPARQLTHYTEDDAQDISNIAWSPDGETIAYTYGAEDGADGHPANPAHLQRSTANVIIVQPVAPGATATTIGEGHNPLFTPDGRTILFVRSGQIWAITNPSPVAVKPCPSADSICELPVNDRHFTGPTQLVFDRGRASGLTLSPDGRLLAFLSHRPTTDGPSHTFLELFNFSTHELTFPAASTGEDSAPTFSPDGKQLAWLRAPYTRQPEYTPHLTSANPWSIQLLDLATSTTRRVYSPEPNKPGSVLPHIEDGEPKLLWSAKYEITDPTAPTATLSSRPERSGVERPAAPAASLIFYSEADGWTHLYALDPQSSASPALLTPGKYEVEDASLSPDRSTLFFVSNSEDSLRDNACAKPPCTVPFSSHDSKDGDRKHLWWINFNWSTPHPEAVTNGSGIETHPVWSADGTVIAALVSSKDSPMQAAIIDNHGKALPFHANAIPASYPATHFVTPQQILIPSTDDLTIHSQLFLPPHLDSSNKHATIIFVHGGPNRQMLLGYPGMDYYSNAYAMNQYLTSLGFIVLSVNYRGGVGYGLNFREAANYGPDGGSEYNDVLAAQRYLVSRTDVDPARIGIWGGSYGGYLTALALARNSNLFAAGVDFHGVHEWSLEGDPDRWMTDPTHATAAQRDAAAALAHASSPMADVDKWKSPVLLIHGDNDPEVNFAQTPILADALRARHVPVEELIFPDEVHGFLLHKDWLTAYTAAAAFFVRTLKP